MSFFVFFSIYCILVLFLFSAIVAGSTRLTCQICNFRHHCCKFDFLSLDLHYFLLTSWTLSKFWENWQTQRLILKSFGDLQSCIRFTFYTFFQENFWQRDLWWLHLRLGVELALLYLKRTAIARARYRASVSRQRSRSSKWMLFLHGRRSVLQL